MNITNEQVTRGPNKRGLLQLINNHNSGRVIYARSTFDGNKWNSWQIETFPHNNSSPINIKLHRGGNLLFFPNFKTTDYCEKLLNEIENKSHWFREYSIQATAEPRGNLFLHEKATDNFDFEEQPGYIYGVTCMKARPLLEFPAIKMLAENTAAKVGVPGFDIGVNVVYYRCPLDSIGDHSDENRNAKIIVTFVVASPPTNSRRVEIKSKKRQHRLATGDEQVLLFPIAGDAYLMDVSTKPCFCFCIAFNSLNLTAFAIYHGVLKIAPVK
jgi:hypothetical protein